MLGQIFTSTWFWLIAIAYAGSSIGGYVASKDPDYGFLGLVSWVVNIAVYAFVILLFWKLPKWYLPIIVLAGVLVFNMLFTIVHGIITKGTPSAGGLRILGVFGAIVGIILTVIAYTIIL